MPELKTTASEDQIEFLRENFSGINDSDRLRSMIVLVEHLLGEKEQIAQAELEDLLTDDALSKIDWQEAAAEGLKRAILESDEFDLTTLAALIQSESDTEDDAKK